MWNICNGKSWSVPLVEQSVMISTVSTCENGNFTVNTQNRTCMMQIKPRHLTKVLFASCMCNHDSCNGSLSPRGPSLSTNLYTYISKTSMLKIIFPQSIIFCNAFNFFFWNGCTLLKNGGYWLIDFLMFCDV